MSFRQEKIDKWWFWKKIQHMQHLQKTPNKTLLMRLCILLFIAVNKILQCCLKMKKVRLCPWRNGSCTWLLPSRSNLSIHTPFSLPWLFLAGKNMWLETQHSPSDGGRYWQPSPSLYLWVYPGLARCCPEGLQVICTGQISHSMSVCSALVSC